MAPAAAHHAADDVCPQCMSEREQATLNSCRISPALQASSGGSAADSLSMEEEHGTDELIDKRSKLVVKAQIEVIPLPTVEPPTPSPPPVMTQRPREPEEGSGGLYVRMVIRQQGKMSNFVWLYKTHKF